MLRIKNEIAVGLLFFLGMGILGYFTIIMKEDLFRSREYYQITVIFPNIEGLGTADRVKINGIDSGIVEEVRLMEDNRVIAYLKMYNVFTLYENYKIKIKNETALGGKYISIDPGKGYDNGNHYAVIENRKNLTGEGSGDILNEITDLIAENRPHINRSIRNIEEITGKINSDKGTLGKLVNDDKVHNDTDDLIKELRETLEDSREQAPITSFIRAALLAF